jgi:hypothetical protein
MTDAKNCGIFVAIDIDTIIEAMTEKFSFVSKPFLFWTRQSLSYVIDISVKVIKKMSTCIVIS